MKIHLTPTQWALFGRDVIQDEALPVCCADVSNLRDIIMIIGNRDGDVSEAMCLLQYRPRGLHQ